VSSVEHFSRHKKRQTDRAISVAYARLAADAGARGHFDTLLCHVRTRAPRLLDAPCADGQHLGIEALINLARYWEGHIRTLATWPGSDRSWRAVVNSLAQHLLSQHRIPAFLSAAWYATDEAFGEAKRRWFVAHGAGASFRSLDLPIQMTRWMEHVFLASPDHLGIEYAMRRAELAGLGAKPALVDAVLAARPALDLHHGDFWRTAWRLLIPHKWEGDTGQVAPLIDFLHAVRHERVAVDTADGIVLREPPLPDFSLKGRTVRSVLRLMVDWHRNLGLAVGGLTWEPSRLRPIVLEVPHEDQSRPPTFWELTELTNSTQLRAEGTALQHCVASYSHACWQGRSRIWSIRRRCNLSIRSVLTVEVDPRRRMVVQARGFRNRRAAGRALDVLQTWAARENLRLAT
jgi:hypothetical protein